HVWLCGPGDRASRRARSGHLLPAEAVYRHRARAIGARVSRSSPGIGRAPPNYNLVMLAIRYVYVLALVVWLGGMVVLGAVVAPTTFQVLQASVPATGRELAGTLFGATLARFHYIAYIAGGLLLVTLTAMRVLGPRPAHVGVRAIIAAVMLAVAL